MVLFGNTGIILGQLKSYEIGIESGPGLTQIHSGKGMYQHAISSIGGTWGGFFQYNFNNSISNNNTILL